MEFGTDKGPELLFGIIATVTALFLAWMMFYIANGHFDTVYSTRGTGTRGIYVTDLENSEIRDVYMGRKEYDYTALSGNTWETTSQKNVRSGAAVYTELLSIIPVTETVSIDGTVYHCTDDDSKNFITDRNLRYLIAHGREQDIYDLLDSTALYHRSMIIRSDGSVLTVEYDKL